MLARRRAHPARLFYARFTALARIRGVEATSSLALPERITLFMKMPGRLSSLLDPSRVALGLTGDTHEAAVREVAGLLRGHPDVTDFEGFYTELMAREALDTTFLGNAIALPHARTRDVKRIVLAVGRLATGVHFANCQQDVRLLFVLGTPKSNPTDYLMVVSTLCKIVNDPANREALLQAKTPDAFIAAVIAAEAKLAPA
jgi:mannitol/fructose-specific phosphotransferase system IIA component (Ntr-type)